MVANIIKLVFLLISNSGTMQYDDTGEREAKFKIKLHIHKYYEVIQGRQVQI